MNNSSVITKNRRLITILIVATVLLTIPFFAMQFSSAVDWKPLDFAIMAILLFGTGVLCELVLRKVKTNAQRIVLCAAIILAFFLIWAELAVGIFGSPFAGS